jgi:uncharacterized repeat protein (TIGR01451 family)
MRYADQVLKYIKEVRSYSTIVLAVALMGSFAVAQAVEQGKGGLKGELLGHKVVIDPNSGKEQLVPVTDALPGDTIEYTLAYRNQDEINAMKDVVIATPIPRETVWIVTPGRRGSEMDFLASIDGGEKYKAPPIRIHTKGQDGKDMEVEASPESYTHLRWVLARPLQAGDTVAVKYRVKVK